MMWKLTDLALELYQSAFKSFSNKILFVNHSPVICKAYSQPQLKYALYKNLQNLKLRKTQQPLSRNTAIEINEITETMLAVLKYIFPNLPCHSKVLQHSCLEDSPS